MLALNSLFVTSCRTFGLVAVVVASALVGVTDGQQTPAQRYEPVRSNIYDKAEAKSDYYPERVHREGVRQIAYQQAAEPAVPSILSGETNRAPLSTFGVPAAGSTPTFGGTTETMARKSPGDFASQMGYGANSFIAPRTNRPAVKTVQSATIPVGVIPQTNTLPKPQALPVTQTRSTKPMPPTTPVATTVRQVAAEAAAERSPVETESLRPRVNEDRFANDLRGSSTEVARQPEVGRIATPQRIAQSATQPIANSQSSVRREAVRDQRVRQTGANFPVSEKATIKIAAPSIEVLTVGPQTIGINKASEYKVVVRNNSSIRAERLLVGVNMPTWVDVENLSMTSGGNKVTDGQGQARIIWSIDQVPGNSSQTMTISAVPRKAEIFDVSVEWTLVPLVGKASVRVTEPKLEMSISGPREVQYGETAVYHVSVRNPGSGAAEDVLVMLPEILGGERDTLGVILPGKEKHFEVELIPGAAGDLSLYATATGAGGLEASAEQALIVRRAALEIAVTGPPLKYSGGVGKYMVTLINTGDATANELVAVVALPRGVKYLNGVDAAQLIEGGMRWPVGSLAPGESRKYEMYCQLNTSGVLQLQVAARGERQVGASSVVETTVETIEDLVLSVADLKGPLPTGKEVPYTIKIRNRGTKAAEGVNLVMAFSDGIEPRSAKGFEYKIKSGKVLFSSVSRIDPGQEMTFEVNAEAYESGTHIFRAELTCQNSDTREVAEGTTRYFGETIDPAGMSSGSGSANTADQGDGNSFR